MADLGSAQAPRGLGRYDLRFDQAEIVSEGARGIVPRTDPRGAGPQRLAFPVSFAGSAARPGFSGGRATLPLAVHWQMLVLRRLRQS